VCADDVDGGGEDHFEQALMADRCTDLADGSRQCQRVPEILRKAFLRHAPLQTLNFRLLPSDRRGGIGRRRSGRGASCHIGFLLRDHHPPAGTLPRRPPGGHREDAELKRGTPSTTRS
jgi:hypothetical protein